MKVWPQFSPAVEILFTSFTDFSCLLTFTLCINVIGPGSSTAYLPSELIEHWTTSITVDSTRVTLALAGAQAC